MIASILLAAAVSLPDVSAVVGRPQAVPFSGEQLEVETERLSDIIRCPVCQGSSVGDSPSEMARNMKQQVKELLALGFTDEQIIQYFEASYGEFIRLDPRREGLNLLVWLAPVGALAIGILIVVRRVRSTTDDELLAPPARNALPDDAELASWILVVREQAYGWPKGIPPEEEVT